jgi:hypothetical protein
MDVKFEIPERWAVPARTAETLSGAAWERVFAVP